MPARLREVDRSVYLMSPGPKFRLNPEGIQNPYSSYPCYYFPRTYSYMEDVVGNAGHYNPVYQFNLSGYLSRFPSVQRGGNPAFTYDFLSEIPFFPEAPLETHGIREWTWLPEFSAAKLSDWSIEAFNKFHDQVPTTVSLPNFLYELKDIKGLIPSINRHSVSKTLSNNFLGFEFGVQPMIKDVKAIVDMFDAVDKRIKHLLSLQGQKSGLSFDRSEVLTDAHSFYRNLQDPYTVTGTGNYVEFKRTSAKHSLHIGANLFQDLNDLSDSMAQMRALIATGGFNKPARVIWNAIPYSFVLDWFFSIGKLLDSLTIQPFGGTYELSDIGYSVKTEATYTATFHADGTDTPIGNPLLGAVTVKSYTRKIGFPVVSLFLTDGLLSPTQQVLALAMLEQRRR